MNYFTLSIVIAIIAGILVGHFLPDFGKEMDILATVFLRAIKTVIVPLLFGTLTTGIAGHATELKKLGRLALRSIIYFEVVTTIALFLGLVVVNIVSFPKVPIPNENTNFEQNEWSFKSEVTNMIPESFFEAAAQNNVLQIVIASIVFAIGMVKTKNIDPMIKFCQSLTDVMFSVVAIVMYLVPWGIFGSLASTIARHGLSALVSVGFLVMVFYLTLIIFVIGILLPILILCKIPLVEFIKTFFEVWLIAFTTASSEAALPLAMQKLEAFGIPKYIVSFVVPTGYSFNLDGTTLYLSLAAGFAAQMGNVDMDYAKQLQMMISLLIMSKGVAAVPRASLVILAGTCAQFNLPVFYFDLDGSHNFDFVRRLLYGHSAY
eukprot:NODE_763_length_4425_cov_0.192094.p1 type:complete len:376 gc:universal NODE_763_length_4425_cov_0.192094:706-1833(+)